MKRKIITKWINKPTVWVDIDTGEIIGKKLQKEYIIINTHKDIKINKYEGEITYIRECRRSTQGKLFE